jgi:hypothetical protein
MQKVIHQGMLKNHECIFCGKELFGRTDKVYCNDTCRNNGNRERRKKEAWYEPDFIRQINTVLKRNYKILCSEVERHRGPAVVGRSWLLDKGFSFKYYTSVLNTKKGTYYFAYDHGWMALADEKIMIVMNPMQASI